MPTHFHAVVWLDHSEAKVFHIGLTGADELTLHPHLQTKHLHHKANEIGSGHAAPDKNFLEEVAHALDDAGEILIIGPSSAKTELAKYLHEKHPAVGKRIVGVEAADHPTDRQIVAYAKQHFKMAPPRVATGTAG
ncbi:MULTISPECIES: translational machinery protein [unclassified Bradyrhizobium]|uniref:translational machinery protein n=1 Tax=unclassified Bradyrhizobium TaxID=2631580 RepID=UPI0028EB77F3|nr:MULTISPECIES: translational machinery protein [unclassified Bradyrhizobium]